MGLKPICRIKGEGKTATTINERMVSCDVVDAAGFQTDSITLVMDASGLETWPHSGTVIEVEMGYEETGIVSLGKFKLTRISEQLLPNQLTLTGTAAPWEASDPSELKKRRSGTYENLTVLDIVRLKAAKHGFTERVHPDLATIVVKHIDQSNEIDLQFLTRLAKKHDAVCKLVNELLIFSRRGQLKTLSGRTMDTVTIRYPAENSTSSVDFTMASIASSDKSKYSGVRAFWYDPDTTKSQEESTGLKPFKSLRQKYDSQKAAREACESELRKIDREGDKLNLECPGNPAIAAEGLMSLDLFPSERMNRTWSGDRVTHKYTRRGGYRTSVQASLPVKTL